MINLIPDTMSLFFPTYAYNVASTLRMLFGVSPFSFFFFFVTTSLSYEFAGLLKFFSIYPAARCITRRYSARVMPRGWHNDTTIARVITAIYSRFFSSPQPSRTSSFSSPRSLSVIRLISAALCRVFCSLHSLSVCPSTYPSIHPSIFFVIPHFAC